MCRLTKAHGECYLPGTVHVAGVVAGEAGAQDHPLHLFHCAPTLCCDNEDSMEEGMGSCQCLGAPLQQQFLIPSQVMNPSENPKEATVISPK